MRSGGIRSGSRNRRWLAVLWPFQHWLSLRIPTIIALAITVVVTSVVGLVFASLIAWGFTRVGQSVVADAARYLVPSSAYPSRSSC